jgi:hypothetical protein
MINGLQILVNFPLFGQADFPNNCNTVTMQLVSVATFDFIDTRT